MRRTPEGVQHTHIPSFPSLYSISSHSFFHPSVLLFSSSSCRFTLFSLSLSLFLLVHKSYFCFVTQSLPLSLSLGASYLVSGYEYGIQSWQRGLWELSEGVRLFLVVSFCYRFISRVPEDTLCLCKSVCVCVCACIHRNRLDTLRTKVTARPLITQVNRAAADSLPCQWDSQRDGEVWAGHVKH